ncbi:MAG: PEP-CTERM sorting domain-containing protein [Phycisphaerae bacterium]|nr:PEP-CTERM sorting domain-containing protein [Phycisphaerae bacterium]
MKSTTITACGVACAFAMLFATPASADCPVAHTHVGVNPTWRPDWSDPGNPALATDSDTSDDNKLWLFSLPPVHETAPTPGWPAWGDPTAEPFLQLVPETTPGGDTIAKPGDATKTLYTCRFIYGLNGYDDPDGIQHLDGWHSALGPQGVWNLAGGDENNEPAWDIGIQRVGTSLADSTDFFMMLPDDTVVLDTDSSTYKFSDCGEKIWEEDDSAWVIHSHMNFYFWLDNSQLNEIAVIFTAYDAGGVYEASDPFTFRFAVPEPGALMLLAVAGLLAMRRRAQ